jgi:hypothetical protein
VRIFLSYAREDRDWAKELAVKLKKAGMEVWEPEVELFPGDNWALETGKALESSQAMVVLVSPAAAASETLQHEVSYALGSEKFSDKLIPVVVRPTRKMPWILDHLKPETGNPKEVSKRIVDRLKRRGVAA